MAARARAARVKDAKSRNPEFNASASEVMGSPGTTGLYLTTLWDDRVGAAPKAWIRAFFGMFLAYLWFYMLILYRRRAHSLPGGIQRSHSPKDDGEFHRNDEESAGSAFLDGDGFWALQQTDPIHTINSKKCTIYIFLSPLSHTNKNTPGPHHPSPNPPQTPNSLLENNHPQHCRSKEIRSGIGDGDFRR
jgi:hypothetical protein